MQPSQNCKKRILVLVILVIKKQKKYSICLSKKYCEEKYIDLLFIGEGKRHYSAIKDFNTFMHGNTLHHGRKTFCRYCLQVFGT